MISSFITSWGYLAVFFGTIFEGETILVAAGFAPHRGMLEWPVVVVVAMLGATLGDQLAFMLGRWKGEQLMARWPSLAQRKQHVLDLLERHDVLFILGIRFLYGLRIAGPVVMGASRIPLLRFALLNIVGAMLWAGIITAAGYFMGTVLEAVMGDLKHIEETLLITILVGGVCIWLWRQFHTHAPVD